jgi:hypothetical protein
MAITIETQSKAEPPVMAQIYNFNAIQQNEQPKTNITA